MNRHIFEPTKPDRTDSAQVIPAGGLRNRGQVERHKAGRVGKETTDVL